MRHVDITAPGKLALFGVILVGAFAVIIAALIADNDNTIAIMASMVGLVGTISGYIVGNGAGAAKGFVSVPPFQPKPRRQLELLTKIVAEDIDPATRAEVERLIDRAKRVEEGGDG